MCRVPHAHVTCHMHMHMPHDEGRCAVCRATRLAAPLQRGQQPATRPAAPLQRGQQPATRPAAPKAADLPRLLHRASPASPPFAPSPTAAHLARPRYEDHETGLADGRTREERGVEEAAEDDDNATDGSDDDGDDGQGALEAAAKAERADGGRGEIGELNQDGEAPRSGAGALRAADGKGADDAIGGVGEASAASEQRIEYEAAGDGDDERVSASVSLAAAGGDEAQLAPAGAADGAEDLDGGAGGAGGAVGGDGRRTALDASASERPPPTPPADARADGALPPPPTLLLGTMEEAVQGVSDGGRGELSDALMALAEALVGRLQEQVPRPPPAPSHLL